MATITPGTGATINAPTIEGQLFQLIHWINNAEAISGGDNNKFSLSKTDGLMESTFTLDGQLIYVPTTGKVNESPLPYLASQSFSAGTTLGTFKSTIFSEYFVDVLLYMITWQRNTIKNTQQIQAANLSFDFATAKYSGSLSLPFFSVLGVNGTITETAIEWLLT
jgi:hypothetical protein